ncbi:alpha/beta hydrolase [Dyella sp. A6]|uniref:alpha/beta hydrolase n=1 Tax=Dyella aluminiiresistens TaxID=3069105 RepID=UPI002E775F38|nr:alpha/beta hydrolase [Dyella sp. A6]
MSCHLLVLLGLLIALPGVALAAPTATPAAAPVIRLWPGGAPPDGPRQKASPTLTAYIPASNPTHTAVVICPGGGYAFLATDWEGTLVAQWFNRHHVAAFVLQYRYGPGHAYPQPIDDGRRAMRWVRYHAAKYGLDPHRIGIMGFSAGGHVASTVSTHFAASTAITHDAIGKVSARPDFTILAYPVISMKEGLTHQGSRLNLIGAHPSPALVESLSNETQVTADTPPAFIYDTAADTTVPPENSVDYFLALLHHHVPAELHMFREGGHGTGLGQHDRLLSVWPKLLARWMAGMGLMDYHGIQPEH